MIVVRLADAGDDAALGRIDLATWTTAVSPAPAPRDPDSYRFFGGTRAPGDVLVAEVNGLAAGWVTVHAPTPLLSNAHVLEIGGLAVDPRRQGMGVGHRLVDAAVRECTERGARKVTLRVLGPNGAARRLYERCGFRIEGVLNEEFLLDGRYVDDVLMARQLTSPAP